MLAATLAAYHRKVMLGSVEPRADMKKAGLPRWGTRLFVLFALQSGDVRLCSFPRLQKSVDELRSEAIIEGVSRHAFTLEKPEHCVV